MWGRSHPQELIPALVVEVRGKPTEPRGSPFRIAWFEFLNSSPDIDDQFRSGELHYQNDPTP